jgi:protein arginine kinase activator
MKCQLCNNQEATVQVKQVYDGVIRELSVCRDCAVEHGLDLESAVPWLSGLMLGTSQPKPYFQSESDDTSCPECHMHLSDFRKTSLLGCPACYDVFVRELAPMLDSMQRGAERHVGKVPRSQQNKSRIEKLQAELSDAVDSQQFEKAAEIRDQIRKLSETRDIEAMELRLATTKEATRDD